MKRLALVFLAVVGLGACGLFQGSLFKDSFWASSPLRDNDEAELGIAEMAKGNYVTAESHFKKALTANPKDVHALLGSGILYQNTGQLTKAREMYEAVLAIRPDESMQFVVWSNLSTRPASQIASVNLSLLDSGGVSTAMANAAQPPAGAAAPMTPTAMTPAPPVAAAPSGSAMLGRPQPTTPTPPPSQTAMAMPSPATMGKFAGGDANVVSRFATLRALRDQGLITEQEFQARRRVNLGALLPLSAPPPAAGLDRPVPATEQISGRLRAIGRALEMRAISVSQHSAERSMILDALMPVAPVVVANPAPPPQGLLEAADSVRRLEQLRDGGFISSDEYAKERQAVELAMQPAPPPQPAAAKAPPKPETNAPEPKKVSTGPRPGIHLASYRSAKQADRGWTQIVKAHKALLEGLEHEVSKVNLGRKGTYYRLKAGPFENADAAKAVCRKLKAQRQFCQPTVLEDGGD